MTDLKKTLAILSLPALAAGYFLIFNAFMFGSIALLFAFSSACGSYGACINGSNGFMLALGLIAFAGTLFVLGAWTNWVATILGWTWLQRRKRVKTKN